MSALFRRRPADRPLRSSGGIVVLFLGACLISFSGLPGHVPAAAFPLLLAADRPAAADIVREILMERVGPAGGGNRVVCRGDALCESDVLPRFYRERGFEPAWFTERGPAAAFSMVDAIRGVAADGLNPGNYHLAAIEELLGEAAGPDGFRDAPPETLADLEMLLTDAFLLCGSHLLHGQVDPETIQPDWSIKGRYEDLAAVLENGVLTGDIDAAFGSLRPDHRIYRDLMAALAGTRDILERGGYPPLPPGPVLHPGEDDERVPVLRKILAATGDLEPAEASGAAESRPALEISVAERSEGPLGEAAAPIRVDAPGMVSGADEQVSSAAAAAVPVRSDAPGEASGADGQTPPASATGPLHDDAPGESDSPALYDEDLESAVRSFQRRHGLTVDGIVGPRTREALNQPVELRILQVMANLERWRWITHDLGRRHVLVNIAGFRVEAVEDGRAAVEMRAVVGRDYRKTPLFTGLMTYLELNPYWTVPPSLASADILPRIRKDPDYLAKQGFRVFDGWGSGAPELDPAGIDWDRLSRREAAALRFRQEPGPLNALGRIKFMFPNKHNVYLHDTPDRHLFDLAERAASSGCIRVERPFELADWLLEDEPDWTPAALRDAIAGGRNRRIVLSEAVKVHLLYWTAWLSPGGEVHFRDDVYRRDIPLIRALRERSPAIALR